MVSHLLPPEQAPGCQPKAWPIQGHSIHLAVKSPHDLKLTVALTPSITISLKFVSLGALPTSFYLVPWAFVTRRA